MAVSYLSNYSMQEQDLILLSNSIAHSEIDWTPIDSPEVEINVARIPSNVLGTTGILIHNPFSSLWR